MELERHEHGRGAARGRDGFARVTREMYVVARQLWSRYYPGKALPPDDAEGRHVDRSPVLARRLPQTTANRRT